MARLNLSDPKMMDVAVPANTACGVTEQYPSTFVRKHMQLMEPTADDDLSAYTIVDVREADEFEGPLGHLPTAELVPLAELSSKMRAWTPQKNCCWCAAVVLGQHRHARFYWMRLFRRTNLSGGMMFGETS